MPTEITEAGYETFRDVVETGWTHIEFRDDNGAALFRIPVADSRVAVTREDGGQTVVFTVELAGSDAEFSLPTTVSETAMYAGASGGDELHADDSAPDATLASAEDTLTWTHRISVPLLS